VSEEVTGIDLVREQFRIAEGGVLDYPDPIVT
jgi:acetyl-CoA/propionyl-CoA carboxylase biotin carboxyl carrier protein